MRILKTLFLTLLIGLGQAILLQHASAQQQKSAESTDLGGESTLERMLTVTFDQTQIPTQHLDQLFTNSGIVRRAAHKVWPDKKIIYSFDNYGEPVSPDMLYVMTQFDSTLGLAGGIAPGITSGNLTVQVRPGQEERKMQQLVDAINEQVLNLLRSRSQALNEQAARERDEQERQLNDLSDQLAKRRNIKQEMVKSLFGNLQPREVLLDNVQQLQRESQSLELDVVSMKVRIEALQKQIAIQDEKAKTTEEQNEAIDNLEKLVAEHEKRLQLLDESNRKSSGAVPREAMSRAREELLKAKVDLARSKAEVRKSAEERISQLVSQLTQNSVDLTVAEARLQFAKLQLDQTLKHLRDQQGVSTEVQRLDDEIERLTKSQERASLPLQFQRSTISPAITVEGADADSEAKPADKSKPE